MKKLCFALLALFAGTAALSADLAVRVFQSLAGDTMTPFQNGLAAPLLGLLGVHSQQGYLTALLFLLLLTGALLAGCIACAASRALESKMARGDDEEL